MHLTALKSITTTLGSPKQGTNGEYMILGYALPLRLSFFFLKVLEVMWIIEKII